MTNEQKDLFLMVVSFLFRFRNALFASILVMLASLSMSMSVAQETGGDDAGTPAEMTEDGAGNGSGRILVPLSGTATVNRISDLAVTPNQIVTELLEVGKSTTSTFTLIHGGSPESPAIQIEEAVLFGKSVGEFSASFNGFETLNPGDTMEVTVTFAPLTPGDKAAGLRLNIAGATTPYVVLFNGSARYPLTSDLGSSDAKVTFGQAIQDSSAEKHFILTNQGESGAPVINVSAIQLSGTNADAFTLDFTPVTLNPGETLDVKVDLQTGTTGFKSARAEVFHDGNNGSLEIDLEGNVVAPGSVPVNFSTSTLNTSQLITRGTSLQFGPDGKLYVAEMDGLIHVFAITRNGKDNYSGTVLESIDLIKNVPNHNDDGTRDYASKRLLTGIHVTGTAAAPVIYAASSDPRQAAGPSGNDSNLDTNSGILHKLSKTGSAWSKQDLVRGLPRSEENHVSNGLVKVGNKIYLNVGGHTNMGVPSNNFAELPEYALSAATLVIDLAAIGNTTYDLPTLNGPADQYDPFGGHDGLNQAKLTLNGPVQIFASGLRNAFDIVYTQSGRFYVWDNGPNTGWGGKPDANCTDAINNGGDRHNDGLHLISQGYYAGHPNPTRGNKANTFGGQTPIEGPANPEECIYKTPGVDDGALTVNAPSTNGLDEYTASNFAGSMQGDLIAAAFNKNIFRVQLNSTGTQVISKSILKANLGTTPLDVTTQGDSDVFPGTIWISDNIAKVITILEPSDY
ncbi:MAG: choice-of-anchor D domain-containing protein [Granulosicoccus sp.]|nr:choice-of-anchor D domain-containing protein [Granulosicoccus sp.]